MVLKFRDFVPTFDNLSLGCHNPQYVTTDNGDIFQVPCRQCVSCRSLRASLQQMRMKLLSTGKYGLMVLLTYDNYNLPMVKVEHDGKPISFVPNGVDRADYCPIRPNNQRYRNKQYRIYRIPHTYDDKSRVV